MKLASEVAYSVNTEARIVEKLGIAKEELTKVIRLLDIRCSKDLIRKGVVHYLRPSSSQQGITKIFGENRKFY